MHVNPQSLDFNWGRTCYRAYVKTASSDCEASVHILIPTAKGCVCRLPGVYTSTQELNSSNQLINYSLWPSAMIVLFSGCWYYLAESPFVRVSSHFKTASRRTLLLWSKRLNLNQSLYHTVLMKVGPEDHTRKIISVLTEMDAVEKEELLHRFSHSE